MRSDALRYGIIGAGMMGLEHLRNLEAIPGAQVVAVADPHPGSIEAARRTSAEGERLRYFEDHRSLLDAAMCDAVVIATPNMTHADILLDVGGAGLPVLVEKPLCTSLEDCRRLEQALGDYQPTLWVGLEYRYMPAIAALLRAVRDGDIGRVWMVAIREHRFPFLTKVANWNRFNRNTGGTLVEKCCHFFDLMCLLTGSEPTRVMGSGGHDVNHLDERYDGRTPDILDNSYVIVDFEGGARAVLDLCMFAEASREMEELCAVGDAGKLEAAIPSGTFRRGLRVGGPGGVREELIADQRILHEGFHHGASYLEHLGFRDAVLSGSMPEVGLADGIRSVVMGLAAQQSIEDGRVVEMAELAL